MGGRTELLALTQCFAPVAVMLFVKVSVLDSTPLTYLGLRASVVGQGLT